MSQCERDGLIREGGWVGGCEGAEGHWAKGVSNKNKSQTGCQHCLLRSLCTLLGVFVLVFDLAF